MYKRQGYKSDVWSSVTYETTEGGATVDIPVSYTHLNPHITRDYIVELEQKPKALREALLLGKWDAFDGQAFPEFVDDPAHYEDGLYTHVIKPVSYTHLCVCGYFRHRISASQQMA